MCVCILYLHLYLGLQICLTNQSKGIHSFTYASLPGVSLSPLAWKTFCKPDTDVAGEHVIHYQLTESDESLADVVKKHCDNKPNIVGLIILHYLPSNFLSNDLLKEGIPQKPPIYVVSCEDGEDIIHLDAFNVNEGDLKVRVKVESEVDAGRSGSSERELKSICTQIMLLYVCHRYCTRELKSQQALKVQMVRTLFVD